MRYSTELKEMGGTYIPYYMWECFKSGMYAKSYTLEQVEDAIMVLTSSDIEAKMKKVLKNWPVSSRHHLSKVKSNRKSWIGQAACFLSVKAPDLATRQAWVEITERERRYANDAAGLTIKTWEIQNSNQLYLFSYV